LDRKCPNLRPSAGKVRDLTLDWEEQAIRKRLRSRELLAVSLEEAHVLESMGMKQKEG